MEKTSNYIAKNLPPRIAAVRNTYGIPIKEAVWLCDEVSVSALTAWEAGLRTPAVDGLYDFASAFAVSILWLCGGTENPYDKDFLFYLETIQDRYPDFLPNFCKSNLIALDETRRKEAVKRAQAYEDIDAREQAFSIAARANLLVLIRYYDALQRQLQSHPDMKKSLRVRLESRLQLCAQSIAIVLITGEQACTIPMMLTL